MKNRPAHVASICLGIAVVVLITAGSQALFADFSFVVLSVFLMTRLLIPAVIYGAAPLRIRRNVWNWLVMIVSSVLLAEVMFGLETVVINVFIR